MAWGENGYTPSAGGLGGGGGDGGAMGAAGGGAGGMANAGLKKGAEAAASGALKAAGVPMDVKIKDFTCPYCKGKDGVTNMLTKNFSWGWYATDLFINCITAPCCPGVYDSTKQAASLGKDGINFRCPYCNKVVKSVISMKDTAQGKLSNEWARAPLRNVLDVWNGGGKNKNKKK